MARTATAKKAKKVYDLVERKPVARFWYQGESHSHPVRRTVLLIEETRDHLIGYELREGNTVRTVEDVVKNRMVKTYRKDRIAKYGDYSRIRMNSRNFLKPFEESTLERSSILTMFSEGA